MNGRSMLVVVLFAVTALIAIPVMLSSAFTTVRASQAMAQRDVFPAAPPPSPAPRPTAAPPVRTEPEVFPELRPVDEAAMSALERPLPSAIVEDASPGRPFRVRLARAADPATPGTLTIDLDRDGRFDEKWTLSTPIARDVSPADDEQYTEHTVWSDRGWQPTAP